MKTIIISPHPDDETLGVGGTILKRIKNGHIVAWLLVTSLDKKNYAIKEIKEKENQIKLVNKYYKFSKVFRLNCPTSELDNIPLKKLITSFSKVFNQFKPNEVFLPHPSDAHTDHKKIFDSTSASTKTFRYPFIQKIFCYETLSETGYGLSSLNKKKSFSPNSYINITNFLDKKIKIAKIYKNEFRNHPFPRSIKSIKSNAIIRGAESNNKFAEAFELLRYIER